MIKVFSPIDTIFTSNGDAVIVGLRAVIRKEDNGIYKLDFACGIEYFEYIQTNNIIVVNTPQGEQAFRIRNIEATRTKITATCKHAYYDSENYLIADSYVVDKNCNDALDHLNSATDTPSPFTTLSDVTTVRSFRCVRQSLNEAVATVLERWGGHLVRDNYNLQIRQSIGQDNGVTIQYRKNLKDITANYNWDNVCTKLLPVGKDGYTLPSLYVYSEVQYDVVYTKTVSFEQDINREDFSDDEHYYAALRDDLTAQAEKYLEVYQYPSVNYTLSANMDVITDVGDTVVVFDERLGINLTTHVLAYEYDCLQDRYISVEFGTIAPSLSNLLTSVSNEIDTKVTISEQTTTAKLTNEIALSESKILGVLGSSYVIYNGDQILVVDKLPKESADNVIRINSQGIAFSQTGINGHFTSAWEINGTLNMQAINVINLTASMIKGGTLKLGSNLNESGILEVFDEANTLIARLDKNGLKMYAQDGSYIVINTAVGFCGYDRDDNKTFYVNEDQFVMKKGVIEQEITLCDKLRFIPIEIYDDQDQIINDGVGIVSVFE